ncbi:DUF3078 domain-containing protein [uncultured Lutibacter sp.]|uniref:DUF3078 domain-containing protein n=1 Tax=uncultured Lutibacter sp. TaxID=437739 RepID=UPI00261F3D6E|nr:DUF3078 domain-containing protein [uncultured Lutibacter sp.]
MKKVILLIVFVLISTITFSQEKEEGPKNGWTKTGNISFLFNQSAFSDWVAGGENNIAGNLGINYDFNYIKDNITWDNKILASYGLTKSKNSEFEKKTDDRFEFNSLVGKKAKGFWYYSTFLNFKTQLAKGYVYGKDVNGKEIRTEFTNLFSPANVSFGPGMLWKKSDNLKFNFAPATAKLIIVDKDFTLPNDAYFGVEEGKSTRLELGFYASGYAKYDIMENVSMENSITLYSNYLEDPQNIDLDYTMNIVMKINKYLSTNFIFQTIYDDNAFEGFQVREVIGVGINYGF